MRVLLLIMALILVVILCCSDKCPTESDAELGPPSLVFGRTFINWAWGYRHDGWYIDSTGAINSFEYTIDDSMWRIEEDTLITLDELAKMESLSTPTDRVIPQDSLARMITLIGPVAHTPAPQPTRRCYDFGIIRYVAYVWDDDRSGYRILTLYQAGDYACKHELRQAVLLYKWLMLSVDGIDSLRWCTP
jgi:hypothetical protein